MKNKYRHFTSLVVLLALIFTAGSASAQLLEAQTFVIQPTDPVVVDARGEAAILKGFGTYMVRAVFENQTSLATALAHGPIEIRLSSASVATLDAHGELQVIRTALTAELDRTTQTFCGNVIAKGMTSVGGMNIGLSFERVGLPSTAMTSCSYFNCAGSCSRCVNCTTQTQGCNSATTCTEAQGNCEQRMLSPLPGWICNCNTGHELPNWFPMMPGFP